MIQWSQIRYNGGLGVYKNVIFDLYGTLVDIRTDEEAPLFWSKVADIFSKKGAVYLPKELRQRYVRYCKEEKLKELIKRPYNRYLDIDLLHVFEKLYKHMGIRPTKAMLLETAKQFRKASIKHIRLYDGVRELLIFLKESNCRIYLLSNAQRSFTLPELEKVGILPYFDGILISSDLRVCKPSPIFFKALLKKYSLDPADCIMIGNDKISDMQGAKNVGIDGIYIHQDISPDIEEGEEIPCVYSVMDGDVTKITDYLRTL